jgi:autotransporter-associated beta strand protein
LSAGYEIIGAFGSGSFTQSGGAHWISDLMVVGWVSGGSGSYSLSGGSLSGPTAYIGYSGSGSFTQTGGTSSLSKLVLAQSAAASGTYNLDGGLLVLSTAGITHGSGTAVLNFGGGTLGASAAWSSALNMNMTGIGGPGTVDTTGGNINLSGNLTGTGGLTKTGAGELILSGSDSFTGGTTVDAGKLVVVAKGAIPDGTSLTVGAGARSAFDLPSAMAPLASSSAPAISSVAAAVPEPGTLALLSVAGVVAVAAGLFRRRASRCLNKPNRW